MKKIFIFVIAAAMCFAFAACAEDTGNGSAEEEEYQYLVEGIEPGTVLGSFSSTDLEGNEVTDAVYADKDVTIVNVWGTYCGPCKAEMPELAALDSELPDNAQIIGVVIDVPTGDAEMIKTAKAICEDNGVTYASVTMNDSLNGMLNSIEAIPTTFILDSAGRTVCKPIVGADVQSYRSAALEYLDQIK